MNLREWIASNVDYGRELVNSGLAGASNSRKEFFDGAPLTPLLSDVNRKVLKLATVGFCIGFLASYVDWKHKPATRAVAGGAFGGAVGLAASLAWSRYTLAETVARGALKNMAVVRDQHWLKSHPIDYA